MLTKTSSPKLSVPQLSVAISGEHEEGRARSSTLMPTAPPVEVWTMTSVFCANARRWPRRRERSTWRRGAVGVADVQVDDRGAGLAAARGFVGDLLRRVMGRWGVCSRVISAPTMAAVRITSGRSAAVLGAGGAAGAALQILGNHAGAAGAAHHDGGSIKPAADGGRSRRSRKCRRPCGPRSRCAATYCRPR